MMQLYVDELAKYAPPLHWIFPIYTWAGNFGRGGYLLGDTVFTNVVISPLPPPPNAHVWSWDRWMMLSLFKSLIGCSFVADLIEKSIHKKPHFCRRGKRKSRISIVKNPLAHWHSLIENTLFLAKKVFILILQFGNYK